jgi:hypothetical protein
MKYDTAYSTKKFQFIDEIMDAKTHNIITTMSLAAYPTA